ncbi:MAG TPA: efflux RND transporter permease subunit, partial [Rhodospirillales bacterium]|nr:efflux RND transporter permease subunit [Rhodospirillales bacterium]
MIRFFALHPTAANLLMLTFLIVGLVSVGNVKRETFPEIPPDKVRVVTAYPVASAAQVESAICERIEDAIDGISEIKEVTCEAQEGVAVASIEMHDGKDIDLFLNDIKAEVDAISTFPDTVEDPVVTQLGRTDFVVAVAVTGPMSAPHLKAYAEDLKDQMLQGGGISQVNIKGFSDHQISIEIPALTLRQYGLSVSRIADVIQAQSIDLPAGSIETETSDVLIRFTDERRSTRTFASLVVVSGKSGSEIRLGDIATITDRFELAEDKIIFNGERAALLEITKNSDEDTLDVVDVVSDFVDRQRQIAPPGVRFELTQNISSIVRDRLDMLLGNGLQGLVLVFLTMWLFFSFRFSFWIAMGLPVSFLGTIFVMSLLGLSFDMISMVGLLIAVGLLMDDAIVLAENIATHVAKGESIVEAAITGTKQVAPGVLASYLTTVLVFGSLMFLKGHIGSIMKVLPIILIATLSVSLVEAFLILPHHLAHARKGDLRKGASRFRSGFEAKLEWVRQNIVGRGVDLAIEWRYLSLGLAIAMLMGSVALVAGGGLKFRVFPAIDGNVIQARILLPQGTPLARTETVVAQVTQALERINQKLSPLQPGGQALIENVNIRFGSNIDSYENGPHVATVSVDLLDAQVRNTVLNDILNMWRAETGDLADIITINFVEFQLGPAGRAIDIRLHGNDLDRLKSASLELQQWLGAYQGVRNLSDDLRPGKPEIRLRLSDGAMALGMTAAEIAGQLRAAFFGKTADEFQ